MEELYRKLYAYLVGQIDGALLLLEEGDLVRSKPIIDVLENALAKAEELYITATDQSF